MSTAPKVPKPRQSDENLFSLPPRPADEYTIRSDMEGDLMDIVRNGGVGPLSNFQKQFARLAIAELAKSLPDDLPEQYDY